jgi:N-acetylglucosaminyl-diphospho-decaprenol L-rhamnosyltransferase
LAQEISHACLFFCERPQKARVLLRAWILFCSRTKDFSILLAKMSQPTDITVVIPVFNQLHYTSQCVDSLNRAGVADAQIIIVNNGSTDGTLEFLASRPQIQAIHNAKNLGCGPAWTQGVKLSDTTWTVILNNDVLVPPGFVAGLVSFAEETRYDIVAPAMREGELDYDWQAHAAKFMQTMKHVRRNGEGHGVCFMVHRRVFNAIGYFNNYGGYEDDDFFRRARRAKFRLAITGRAWLHHFGSTTQKAMKITDVKQAKERRWLYRQATGQTWLQRKAARMVSDMRAVWWRHFERLHHGHTLHEKNTGERQIYC